MSSARIILSKEIENQINYGKDVTLLENKSDNRGTLTFKSN